MTRALVVLRWLMVAALASSLGGCASFYVDGNAPEVPSAAFTKPAQPAEVQLIWEFQTRGVANVRATELLKARVKEQIANSGLFSSITETPASGGAMLSVTVNNIPLSDDAVSKGFVAGLTFGLAGQTVGDGYECTARYLSGRSGAPAAVSTGKHIIFANIGAASQPPGSIKASSAEEAVGLMLRQLISRTLNDLSKEKNFP